MDIQARLQQLLRERGWTEYRLSKECGLAANTIGISSVEIQCLPLQRLKRSAKALEYHSLSCYLMKT